MILQQAWMADRRRLTHWAFVQTFSNYARGVYRKSIHNSNYWVLIYQPAVWNGLWSAVWHSFSDQLEFLRKYFSLVWIVDNFRKGGEERKH